MTNKFTSDFLITHELSHFVTLMAGKPEYIPDYLELGRSKVTGVVNYVEYGSAGFQFAARSSTSKEDFAADAVANWVGGTYTQDANGQFRQGQMNDVMGRVLDRALGKTPPSH